MIAPQERKPTLLSTPTMIGTNDFFAPGFPEGVSSGLAIDIKSPVGSLPDGLKVLDENVLLANMLGVDSDRVLRARDFMVNVSGNTSMLVLS